VLRYKAEYSRPLTLLGLRLDKIGKGFFRAACMPVRNLLVPKKR
jgi:hypothetical protein